MSVEHIGIAVRNLEKSLKIYAEITGTAAHREDLKREKVRIATFNLDSVKIELLEGINENSPISKFLKDKNKDTIHHIAFKVENISRTLQNLEKSGYELIKGYPQEGAHGTKVAFLHPKATGGVLIELVQK